MSSVATLTVEEKITKAKIKAQLKKPFFAYLLLNCPIINAPHLAPTMGTDARGNIYFNPEWVDKLGEGELQGTMFHEIMHQALLHLIRIGSRDRQTWNYAADLVINAVLLRNDVVLPEGVLRPDYNGDYTMGTSKIKECHKKSAEEVYDEIMSKPQLKKQLDKKFKPMDTHIYVDGKDGQGNKKGKGLTKGEARAMEGKWKKAMAEATQFAKQKGNMPSGMERILEKLLEPEVNWKTLLNKFVVSNIPYDNTWRTPHKRSIATGMYMPNVLRENIEVSVAVDVSGSIGDKEYAEFISEMIGIARSFSQVKMNVLFWDTKVGSDVMVENGNVEAIKRANVQGYGGTDLSCVTKYLEKANKNPKVLIVFTDGYIESQPKLPNVDVLIWVINKNGSDEIAKTSSRPEIIIKMKRISDDD